MNVSLNHNKILTIVVNVKAGKYTVFSKSIRVSPVVVFVEGKDYHGMFLTNYYE